jgi:hypothetical protein
VLGIFLTAFFQRQAKPNAVFVAAIVSELVVVAIFLTTKVSFLWYNVIGCVAVFALAGLLTRASRLARAR